MALLPVVKLLLFCSPSVHRHDLCAKLVREIDHITGDYIKALITCSHLSAPSSMVGVKAGTIDFSFYNEEENMAWRNSFHALITACSTFFLTMGVTTPEELAELSVRVGSEMFAKDFCGVGSLFTFYGMRVK